MLVKCLAVLEEPLNSSTHHDTLLGRSSAFLNVQHALYVVTTVQVCLGVTWEPCRGMYTALVVVNLRTALGDALTLLQY
jgi:hypothetical protein